KSSLIGCWVCRRSGGLPPAHWSAGDTHREGLVTLDEARIHPLGLADHLHIVEPVEDLSPDYLELQFGQPDSDATMDTETERDMGARPGAVNNELIGTIDHLFVTIARDVPHHHLVAFFHLLAAELEVGQRGAAHMRQRGLPADHFRHETVDQSEERR